MGRHEQETGCAAIPEDEPVAADIEDATAQIPSREVSAALRPESPHEPSTASPRRSSRGDEQSRFNPAKHQRGTTGAKAKTHSKGEIRFPITDVEPASPRVVLPEKRVRDWQNRMQSGGGRMQDEDGLDGYDDQKDEWEPTLEWYADQLLAVCGRALISASARVISLQARHSAGVAQLDGGQQMWHLLLEVITLFAAADYHITRAAEVLRQEVGTSFVRRGSTSSSPARQVSAASFNPARQKTCSTENLPLMSGGAGVADNGLPAGSQVDKPLLPMPPFMPRGADAALADLHLRVARLQSSGPQLAAFLRRLPQGVAGDAVLDVQRLLEAMSIRGCKGAFGQHSFGSAANEQKDNRGRLQTLFMAVPCIEEAVDRLGTLVCLVERSQAVKVGAAAGSSRSSRKSKANTDEAVDDALDFIQEDEGYDEYGVGKMMAIGEEDEEEEDSQELVEAVVIAPAAYVQRPIICEAPKPPVKASGRPQSARRGGRPGSNDSSPQASLEAIPHIEVPEKRRQTEGQKNRDSKAPNPFGAAAPKPRKKKS